MIIWSTQKTIFAPYPTLKIVSSETESLASDSPASNNYQNSIEALISNATCSSNISDIKVLMLEGNLILVEAAGGAIYQQLVQRFLQLGSLVIQRQQQCQPKSSSTASGAATSTPKAYLLINTMVKAKQAAKALNLPPPTNLTEAWQVLFQQRQTLAKQRGQGALIDYLIGEEPVGESIAPADSADPLDPAYSPYASQVTDALQTDTQKFVTGTAQQQSQSQSNGTTGQ